MFTATSRRACNKGRGSSPQPWSLSLAAT